MTQDGPPAAGQTSRWRPRIGPVPLFLLLGLALFGLDRWLEAAQATLVVAPADVQRIAAQWQAQMGQPVTANELQGLVQSWVAEELMVREARAMGLDADDTIVRRRLVQKLSFLTEDTLEEPSPAEVEDWFAEHAERYQHPATVTFRQTLFSQDRHADAQAKAQQALAGNPEAGDPSMLPRSMVQKTKAEVAVQFGRDFAERLAEVPQGQWQGPVRSPYGWHLVLVDERRAAQAMALDEARPRVLADLQRQRNQQAKEQLLARLRANTRVQLPPGLEG